jgi:hypothetical protein
MQQFSVRTIVMLLAAAGTGVLAACASPTDCAFAGRPAITAEIRDAATGLPAAWHASLVTRSGTVVDSVFAEGGPEHEHSILRLPSRSEAPGTYSVAVRRDGYETWTRESVVVPRRASCGGTEGVVLQVALRALSQGD